MPITRNVNITNSVLNQTSRYTQGGLTDVFTNRVGFWDRFDMPRASDDLAFVIDARTNIRPDLVSYDIYEKANLQWFVLQYNNIVDINEEFITGRRIVLPTPVRLLAAILTRSTGGRRIANV